MPFARAYVDLHDEMIKTRLGQPQLPAFVPPAVQSFEQLEWADRDIWRHADLNEVFNYMRKSRRLKIPEEWQNIVPTRLD